MRIPWTGTTPRVRYGPGPKDIWLFISLATPAHPEHNGRTIRVRLDKRTVRQLHKELKEGQ